MLVSNDKIPSHYTVLYTSHSQNFNPQLWNQREREMGTGGGGGGG
jgi:hypothetical protein